MRCRLCLFQCNDDNAENLFHNGEESAVTKLITKYIQLEISLNDAFCTALCESCFQHLNEFHHFVLFVEQRQTELKNEFMEVECILTEGQNAAVVEKATTLENNHESMLEIEEVIIKNEGTMEFKEEFGFVNECNIPEDDGDNVKSNMSDSCTPPKHNEDKIENSKQLNRSAKQCMSFESTTTISKKKRGRPRKNITKDIKLKTKKSNALTEENKQRDEQILKSINLKCELCEIPANTFGELRAHFREVHNTKAYVLCCGRHFRRRCFLLEHLKHHLNPEQYKCEICNKVLKSKNCLDNHHANMHSDGLERKHECTICGKRFAYVSFLNSHLFTHASSRDHICETCNKGFKSAILLKKHCTHVHENKHLLICEICGQKYKHKRIFQQHVAEHDAEPNQLTEECPICKKWFRPNGLRAHMGYHNIEELKCEICGKIVKSKLALKSHIRYWHTQTKTLNCTFCEKTFKRSDVLKEHIAMHTGQMDYNCPHCQREFRSKAYMFSHIRKMHAKEWMQEQMARTRVAATILEKQND